ncbi:FtsX-like permease family protein [Intestinibacter sp.]
MKKTKNNAYSKSIKREIASSKARFISIMAIIFLGVAFYAGIKSSGPDLELSISNYFDERGLMDSKIVSSLGLNENDLKLLQNNDKISDYYATKSVDVNMTKTNHVVKFMENTTNTNMNKLVVVEGKLPQKSGEIVLDEQALKSNPDLKIGDNYRIKSDKYTEAYFKKKTFKIVGFVQSPMHIDFLSRGTATVGKGSIDYFAVINKADLDLDAYTEIYVRFANVANMDAYSDEYKETMEKNTEYLKDLYSNRAVQRIEEVKAESQSKIEDGYKEIEEGEEELEKAQQELNDGKKQLQDGKKEYQDGVKKLNQEIQNGKAQITDSEKQLLNAQKQLDAQKTQIEQGEKQLTKGKQDLENAKKQFLAQGVDPTKSTAQYQTQIDGLNTMISTYNSLSNDINKTVAATPQGESISDAKIQYWKAMISNPQLGLSDLSSSINSLEQNPTNTNAALGISANIKARTTTLNNSKSQLQTLVAGITEYQKGVETYEQQLANFNRGKAQLEEAQKTIYKNKKTLAVSKTELEKGEKEGQSELAKAKQKLDDAEQEIIDGQKEIDKNKKKLEDGKKELDEAKDELDKQLNGSKYYYFDREDNSGYSTYKGSIDSLDKIASVFPVFFFLVAALICLTTMTRMVEENRTEIGTLKALGYRDYEIAKKFIIYAMLATIVGSVLGIAIGCVMLPKVISQAYSSAFMLPSVKIKLYSSYIIQSVLCSLICTVGASLLVLKQELKEQPSALMRVKAPKVGKKILLERITPIWKRLNFN